MAYTCIRLFQRPISKHPIFFDKENLRLHIGLIRSNRFNICEIQKYKSRDTQLQDFSEKELEFIEIRFIELKSKVLKQSYKNILLIIS